MIMGGFGDTWHVIVWELAKMMCRAVKSVNQYSLG